MSFFDDTPSPIDFPLGSWFQGTRNIMENATPVIMGDPRKTDHTGGHLYGFMIVDVMVDEDGDTSISLLLNDLAFAGRDTTGQTATVSDMGVPREGHDKEYFFTVPPQNIQFTEPGTVQVQPTIDGYLVEHHGSLLKQLNISGTTGFRPMSVARQLPRGGIGTGFGLLAGETQNQIQRVVDAAQSFFSIDERGLPANEITGYFNFMQLRSLFRHYFDLKSNRESRSNYPGQIRMIWVNFHELEFWFCEPLTFATRRESSSPLTFGYDISCYLLDRPDDLAITQFQQNWFSKMLDYRNYVGMIIGKIQHFNNLMVQIADLSDAISSDILGAVRRVVTLGLQTAASVGMVGGRFRELGVIGERLEDLMVELQDVSDVWDRSIQAFGGDEKLRSKYDAFEEGNKFKDSIRAINRVRAAQRDQQANPSQNGTLVSTQRALSSRARGQNTGSNPGQANLPKPSDPNFGSDLDVRNARSNMTGGNFTTVILGEDIRAVSRRTLGTESRWKEIVIVNGLSAPYIAASPARGVLMAGDRILIPGTTPISRIEGNLVFPTSADEFSGSIDGISPENAIFGRDIAVQITGNADTGTLNLDIKPDPSGDVALIEGIKNFQQALLLLSNTEGGTLKLHPGYGFPRVVGMKSTHVAGTMWSLHVKRALKAEPRVAGILNLGVGIIGDVLIGKIDVLGQQSLARVPLTTRSGG
jgi:hypothetical protein